MQDRDVDNGLKNPVPNMITSYRDHMIMWAKDVGRSVDYLECGPISRRTRSVISVIAGVQSSPLILAVEPRISLGVICLGAISLQPSLPEADPVNFAPRLKVPVLMLNATFRLLLPNGDFTRADIQAARDPYRTQTPRRLRDITLDSPQRDD